MTMARFLCAPLLGLALVCCTSCMGRIGELEQQVKALKSDLNELRSIQAEETTSINDLRSDLRQVYGKVDELNYHVTGKTAELERTLEQVSSRVPPPPGVPDELLNADEEAIARINGPAADQYRSGLRLIRSGEFDKARDIFQSFVDQNPATAFSDNAVFWVGIAQMGLSHYDRAIVAFSDVYQRYPAEDRVPAALYFLAESFARMGQTKDADLSYQKLIDEHPKSEWAAKARAKVAAPAAKKKK